MEHYFEIYTFSAFHWKMEGIRPRRVTRSSAAAHLSPGATLPTTNVPLPSKPFGTSWRGAS